MTEKVKPIRRWKQHALALGVGMLAAAVGCMALLAVEDVQRGLLEGILRRALGLTVTVEGVGLGNPVTLERVALGEIPTDPDWLPMATLKGLSLEHTWNPFATRPVDALRLEELRIQLIDLRFSNYDALRYRPPSSSRPGRVNPLPREFALNDFTFEMTNRRWHIGIEGVGAKASLESMESFSGSVSGEKVHLNWRTGGGEEEGVVGKVDAQANLSEGQFTLNGTVDVPEVIRLPFGAEASTKEGREFHFLVENAELHRAFWPPLLADYAGLWFDFEHLRLPVALVDGVLSPELRLNQGKLELGLEGLSVGQGEDRGPAVNGGLSVEATREGQTLKIALHSTLPELLVAEATAEISDVGEDREFRAMVAQAEMHSRALAERVLRYSPFPLSVESLVARDTEAAGRLHEGQLEVEVGKLDVATRGLIVGPRNEPIYEGDLALVGSAALGMDSNFAGAARFAQGEAVDLKVAKLGQRISIEATLPAWTRDALETNAPKDYRGILTRLPGLDALGGHLEVDVEYPAYTIEATFSPRLSGLKTPAALTVSGGGALGEKATALFAGPVGWKMGSGEVNATIRFAGAEDFDVDATAKKVSLLESIRIVREEGLPEGLEAQMDGTAKIQRREAGYEIQLDLAAAGARYASYILPPEENLQLRGDISLDGALTQAHGKSFAAEIAGKIQVTNSQWNSTLSPFTAQSKISGRADLGFVGGIAGFPDLFGEATWEGALRILDGPVIQLDLHAQSETLGYGDWSIPYRMPLSVDGPVEISPDKQELRGTTISATLGEGNVLKAGSMLLSSAGGDGGVTIEGSQWTIESDLSPAVALSLLGNAENAHARIALSTLKWSRAAIEAPMKVSLDASMLELPNQVARLEALKFDGEFLYKGDFSGIGSLETQKLTAGGVSLEGINTAVRGEGPDLVLDQIQSSVFGGTVSGNVRLGLAREALAVEVSIEMSNIDLDTFTKEFKPPGVTLTGRASGSASVAFSHAGIQDFKAKLTSTDGFSLNRDMVERALLSQYIGGVSGGKKIQDVMQDVIGSKPQRAFDSAELDLGFENGQIAGVLPLKSKKLNLTIDVTADPRTLVDAMQIRQEQAAGSPPAGPSK